MRAKKDTDFFVELPDVGTFRFGRQTYGDRLKVRAEMLKLTGSETDDEELSIYAAVIASHRVLCVEAPEGWEDLEALDIVSQDNEARIFALFRALREKEDSFRPRAGKKSEEGGQGTL